MKVLVDTYAWLDKSCMSGMQLLSLKKRLTVIPKKFMEDEEPKPIYLYKEEDNRIGVARDYFLANNRGRHQLDIQIPFGNKEGWPWDLKFAGTLREEQDRALEEIVARFEHGELGGLLQAGCGWGKSLVSKTLVTLAETGERTQLGSLVGSAPLVPSLLGEGSIGRAVASTIWKSGRKPCFKLTLASGQWLEASLDHPVLTQYGWKRLDELVLDGSMLVAAARTSPDPVIPYSMSDAEVTAVGLYIADGCNLHNSGAIYCKGSVCLTKLFEESVKTLPGFSGFGPKRFDRGAWYIRPCGVRPWLRFVGLDKKSTEKRIPGKLFGLPREQLALLIRTIWTDGSLYLRKPPKLEITLGSEGLVDDLQEALRRFGVVARKSYSPKRPAKGKELVPAWRLQIADVPNLEAFIREVGPIPGKEDEFKTLETLVRGVNTNTNWDVVPVGPTQLRDIRKECRHVPYKKWETLTRGGNFRWMSRSRFERLVKETGYTGDYAKYANMDVVWERPISVEPLGIRDVYDITVPGPENVVANGLVVHNTTWACALIARLQIPTLIVVHKKFLMDQWIERIEQFLPTARVGIVQQDRCEFFGKHVVIAMVHSLSSHPYDPRLFEWPDLTITDECFPSKTLIATPAGSVPIELISEGDSVYSSAGLDTVVSTSRKRVPLESLRLIRFASGSEVICTDNHPFLTMEGWTPSRDLVGRLVLTYAGCCDTMYTHGTEGSCDSAFVSDVRKREVCEKRKKVLLEGVYGRGEAKEGASAPMRVVWRDPSEQETKSFLFSILSGEMAETTSAVEVRGDLKQSFGISQRASRDGVGGVRAYAIEESYARSEHKKKGKLGSEGDRTQTSETGWKWEGHVCSSEDSFRFPWIWLGGRIRATDGSSSNKCRSFTEPLQGRYSSPKEKDSRRSGRAQSLRFVCKNEGLEERELDAVLRVDSVSIPERRDIERLGFCVGEDNLVEVCNIGVLDHPSYVLASSKVVVHNCHRIGAPTWSPTPARVRSRLRLGLTATPRRKDGAENVFRYHIGRILFEATGRRLEFKVRRVWTPFSFVKTPRFNPDTVPAQTLISILIANRDRNRILIQQLVLALKAGRKVLVLSERLKHLDLIEAMLKANWPTGSKLPSIGYYVGGRKQEELDKAAKCRVVLATKQLVSEGLDIPALDTLILSTPMSDVEQAVGRILRPCKGKKDPIVVDLRDDKVPRYRAMGDKRQRFYDSLLRVV